MGIRHLGLSLPEEVEGLRQQLERLADCLEEGMDWESFWKIAEGKLPWDISPKGEEPGTLFTEPFSLAVARDPAFCFYYQDNLRALEAAGAILHDFSPLTDEALPPGCCGILLGGGYPENFAKELGENQACLLYTSFIEDDHNISLSIKALMSAAQDSDVADVDMSQYE